MDSNCFSERYNHSSNALLLGKELTMLLVHVQELLTVAGVPGHIMGNRWGVFAELYDVFHARHNSIYLRSTIIRVN